MASFCLGPILELWNPPEASWHLVLESEWTFVEKRGPQLSAPGSSSWGGFQVAVSGGLAVVATPWSYSRAGCVQHGCNLTYASLHCLPNVSHRRTYGLPVTACKFRDAIPVGPVHTRTAQPVIITSLPKASGCRTQPSPWDSSL